MIVKKYDNTFCIRLIHEDDFLEKLTEFIKERDLKNAILINAVGMLNNAEIGYYADGDYIKDIVPKPAELISTNGNLFTNPQGEIEWHIHVALAKKSHEMVGGHLFAGKVWNTAEIFIQTLPQAEFYRLPDENGNLRLNFR
ncbi:MAG: DUF296 domain-containing protein [Candidatus Cloacimonetes bacterium]|nr:DUF296 domain-containing protein [Candidatus Cloacimonadota bacterium]MBS3767279.1 DUF296 domain-containing protein [Candidatus Cloacimonadota bacterium]